MSQYIQTERKSRSYSTIDFRKVTNRQIRPPAEKQSVKTIAAQPSQQQEEPSIQQETPHEVFKIKKKELLPPDPTAPVFIQFHKVVVRASSIILRAIGTNRRDLKPLVNDAFDMFFKDFDNWWTNKQRVSQRKDTTNVDIGILKNQLNECNQNIRPLRDQCYLWKMKFKLKDYLDISCPQFEPQQIIMPPIEKDDEMKDGLVALSNGIVVLSHGIQKSKNMLSDTKRCVNGVSSILQFEMRVDMKKQLTLRNRLCNNST